MYRSINAEFWTDKKIRLLTLEEKAIFLYLITNPHTHVSGIYYLPLPTMEHETNVKGGRLLKILSQLSSAELIQVDTDREVIWVVNMLRYQGHGKKIAKGVIYQLKSLHQSPLISSFLKVYPYIRYSYPIDTPLIPPTDRPSPVPVPVPSSVPIQKEGKEIEKGDDGFERFWKLYPRKVGKGQALRIWKKIAPMNGLCETICRQVEAACKTKQWQKEGGEYIPHPSTWLNQSRWEDDYSSTTPIKVEGHFDRMAKLVRGED